MLLWLMLFLLVMLLLMMMILGTGGLNNNKTQIIARERFKVHYTIKLYIRHSVNGNAFFKQRWEFYHYYPVHLNSLETLLSTILTD